MTGGAHAAHSDSRWCDGASRKTPRLSSLIKQRMMRILALHATAGGRGRARVASGRGGNAVLAAGEGARIALAEDDGLDLLVVALAHHDLGLVAERKALIAVVLELHAEKVVMCQKRRSLGWQMHRKQCVFLFNLGARITHCRIQNQNTEETTPMKHRGAVCTESTQ